MEAALTDHLLASAALVALVGPRITWDERPQGDALPAVVLQWIDGAPEYSDEGFAGLTAARLQIDCWATHGAGNNGSTLAKEVARLVVAALPVSITVSGVEFQGIFPEAIRDFPPEMAAAQIPVFRRSIDYLISFTE
jgi:hypothetical protein